MGNRSRGIKGRWNCTKGSEILITRLGNTRGFSLTESLIVMALMAILTGIAAPSIAYWMTMRSLDAATRELATDLQLARHQAIRENGSYRLVLPDNPGNSYRIEKLATGQVSKSRDLAADYPGVALASSASAVTFHSQGTAVGATITVQNSHGKKRVRIASTGRVKIE